MYNAIVPIMYQINREKRTIRTKCFGQVTMPEVIDHFRALGDDRNCPDRLDAFLDVSEVTGIPESSELSAVVTELKKFRNRTRFETCAIVATSDALFGMMRMFETLAEEYFGKTRTFRDAAEAQAWLAEQQTWVARKRTAEGST